MKEVHQDHDVRVPLYKQLERALGPNRAVVTFFTSFSKPAVMEDDDVDMLEVLGTKNVKGALHQNLYERLWACGG